MNTQRIERALRDGPADEPIYVPGSFRRAVRSGWSWALLVGAVAAAVVVTVAVGLALGMLRGPNVGAGVDVEALHAQLEGNWASDTISRQEWVSSMEALGYDVNDLEIFLDHEVFQQSIEYRLAIGDEVLTNLTSFDDGPPMKNSDADYRILEDGRLQLVERTAIGQGLGDTCTVTMSFDSKDDRLTFGRIQPDGCALDERMAYSSFFNLVPYIDLSPDSP